MKIEWNPSRSGVAVLALSPGDLFGVLPQVTVYMRLDRESIIVNLALDQTYLPPSTVPAVRMDTGEMVLLTATFRVIPIEGTLTIKGEAGET